MNFLEHWVSNPCWRTIRILGQAKVLGISAATIIVVPLLSRVLVKLNEMETTLRKAHPALDALFPLVSYQLQLPLALKLLVGSAFFAMIGKLIYEGACPLYIKVGDTYSEFRHSQPNAISVLVDAFLEILKSSDGSRKKGLKDGLIGFHRFLEQPGWDNMPEALSPSTPFRINSETKLWGTSPLRELMRDQDVAEPIFYILRDVMDECRRPWRILCASFYYVALGLFLGALSLQLYWAIRGVLL